ncbi:MAG: heavy-metal-associated domain-containing protein [Chloroflexi bacterium]|nr:heavy-metal-associated domain-containing protein [Chloroflexota bacterium]MCL5274277.1 heavy-metal-associated domain-containing protein [Chloroflexota bacterium]
MEKLTLDLPGMYGDHHVTEVRRILLEMPGVEAVYASSCFQIAEVTYDPSRIDADTIIARLDKASYLGDLVAPLETGEAVVSPDGRAAYFRHTIAYQQTGQVIGFAQNVSHTGRALWPCPGMETMKTKEGRDGEERA